MGEQRFRCPACDAEPRAGARYCDGCGTALSSPPRDAEYKQVTVLFVDITRSMDIAAAVGPERLREIMSELFDRWTAVVFRFGGTVDKFIGDGLMALFGAPVALEDHALRACLAALGIQTEARRLAPELRMHDGIDFRIRVGLNSGEVIAGELGSSSAGYTVIGEQVGLAQRMESVAPPGGVMLSATTARLVEHRALLGDTEWVRIKGATDLIAARRLLDVIERHGARPGEAALAGRRGEIAGITASLDDAVRGRGVVVALGGPPGIGKSRITREIAAMADARGIDVIWTYCQSLTTEVPFRAVTELARTFFGISGEASEIARAATRSALPSADADDLRLLDDLLGIGDHEAASSDIDPDAKKRRLTALLESALLSRRKPALYVIEDVHWIDAVSEAMLAHVFANVADSSAVALVTHRPEYAGALSTMASRVRLAPLDEESSSTLTKSLLGEHPSVAGLARRIIERAAGNPFFLEEIVRDLAERGVLVGSRGSYTCDAGVDVVVPATVQATIASRIDRLGAAAKRTLNTAAVIGSPFSGKLVSALVDGAALPELIRAELVSQVSEHPVRYAFRHPLMRAVAYESQLKSGRARLHRTIADALQAEASATTNPALIATHLEAAGDVRDAFSWHMQSGTWSTHRDIAAARISWQRAAAVADRLPETDPDHLEMRIAPRTLLCATIWRVGGELADVGFDELRALADAAGDKRALAVAMTGLVQMLNFHGRYTDASELASEQVELLEQMNDPELSMALLPNVSAIAKWDAGEMSEALQLAQRAVDLSGGNPTMGNLIIGSPLALALAMRASTRCCLGIPGWRQDFDDAVAMARSTDKFSYSTVVMFKYIAILNWALTADDDALRDTAEALEIARQFGDNFLLTNAEFTHGLVLVRRQDVDRALGFELLARSQRAALANRYTIIAAWCVDLDVAAEAIRAGDLDKAIELASSVLDNQVRSGEGINRGWATSVLVEALLTRGGPGDFETAAAAIDRLAAMPTEPVYLYHELPLLRMRAMLARAQGDDDYAALRDAYRVRAEDVGFTGHLHLALTMD